MADAARAEQDLEGVSQEGLDAAQVMDALGPDWQAPLTDFQLRDLGKLLSLRHGANFSVPGAGKTRVALAVYVAARRAGRASRLLVVAPKSAFEAWLDESAAVVRTGPISTSILSGRQAVSDGELVLVNYERLTQTHSALTSMLLGSQTMMVLDLSLIHI